MKVKSKITGKEVEYEAKHIALLVDDNNWQHDKWIVLLDSGRVTVDYSTGIGHRKHKGSYHREEFAKLKNTNWKQNRENLILVNKRIEKCSRPIAPDLDDVLYSLAMDSYASDVSFVDWCADYGYDTDSIKATDTYKACQESAAKLREIGFNNLEELRELFADY